MREKVEEEWEEETEVETPEAAIMEGTSEQGSAGGVRYGRSFAGGRWEVRRQLADSWAGVG